MTPVPPYIEFMKHKKQEHRQSVPACINETQGTCVFGEEKEKRIRIIKLITRKKYMKTKK